MRDLILATIGITVGALPATGQGLHEVPQRFAYVQPVGLVFGVGTAGLEFAIGRTTSVEVGGIAVYSQEDGVAIYGGGPGVGVRQYFGQGRLAGLVVGARTNLVRLTGDNASADNRFIALSLRTRESRWYFGLAGSLGYRLLARSGFFFEPLFAYQFLGGTEPIVPGADDAQDRVGPVLGISFGLAW